MHRFNRRDFLKSAGAIAAFAAIPRAVSAAVTSPRVVVVGGAADGTHARTARSVSVRVTSAPRRASAMRRAPAWHWVKSR